MKKVVASAWLWRILNVVRNTFLLKTVQTWRRRSSGFKRKFIQLFCILHVLD